MFGGLAKKQEDKPADNVIDGIKVDNMDQSRDETEEKPKPKIDLTPFLAFMPPEKREKARKHLEE